MLPAGPRREGSGRLTPRWLPFPGPQYLVVPNALDASLLSRLIDVADRVSAAVLAETPEKFHVATSRCSLHMLSTASD